MLQKECRCHANHEPIPRQRLKWHRKHSEHGRREEGDDGPHEEREANDQTVLKAKLVAPLEKYHKPGSDLIYKDVEKHDPCHYRWYRTNDAEDERRKREDKQEPGCGQ